MKRLPAVERWIPLAWVSDSQFSLAASLRRSSLVESILGFSLQTPKSTEVVLFAMLSGPWAQLGLLWLLPLRYSPAPSRSVAQRRQPQAGQRRLSSEPHVRRACEAECVMQTSCSSLRSGARDFLARLLYSDPAERLGAAEALSHPWLVAWRQPIQRVRTLFSRWCPVCVPLYAPVPEA